MVTQSGFRINTKVQGNTGKKCILFLGGERGVQSGANFDRDRKSRDQQINSKMDDFVDVHEYNTQI